MSDDVVTRTSLEPVVIPRAFFRHRHSRARLLHCVAMKIFLLSAVLACYAAFAQAQEPELGIYRGYITTTRTNAAFKVRDVSTILITAEIYKEGDVTYILWTPRNLDPIDRLANLWANYSLEYNTLPVTVPDIALVGTGNHSIFCGATVPGSFKMTAKTLAWKATSVGSSTAARRNVSFATTFYISRVGPSPAPDQ